MPLSDELFFSTSLGIGEVAARLLLATALGGVVGLDRELRRKPLGLRSFMLVALGAALFCLMVTELVAEFGGRENTEIDPARIVQGVVIGIGFLGAGAIIQSRGDVIGGTTGATVWAVGGIGMACGFGLYLHAVLGTGLVMFILTVIGMVQGWFGKRGG